MQCHAVFDYTRTVLMNDASLSCDGTTTIINGQSLTEIRKNLPAEISTLIFIIICY